MKHSYPISSKIINEDAQKISFLEYFYVFVLIIYAGMASTFVNTVEFGDNPIAYSIPIILSGILAVKWKIKLNKQFVLLILGLFFYFIAITIKYNTIHLTIFSYYFLIFFILYVIVRVFNFNFFRIYEFLIYRLAIIALAIWSIQTILQGDTLYNIINKIPGIHLFSSVSGDGGLNTILYSIQPSTTSLLYGFSIPRNCGFAWEPGGFAIYLCLALFINFFITNPKKKLNAHFWVLLIALISTQSTTGYTILSVLILFYYLNKKSASRVLILPLLLIAIISVFTLPFMTDKIIFFAKDTNDVDYIVWQSIGNESGTSPQRFTSFLIFFRDFYNNPILGNAGIKGESWIDKIGANISPISGIGNLLATLGIVGFLFFVGLSLKTSFFFSRYFKYQGRFLLFIIILLISISYSVIFLPIMMSFWMFGFYGTAPANQNKRINSFRYDNKFVAQI